MSSYIGRGVRSGVHTQYQTERGDGEARLDGGEAPPVIHDDPASIAVAEDADSRFRRQALESGCTIDGSSAEGYSITLPPNARTIPTFLLAAESEQRVAALSIEVDFRKGEANPPLFDLGARAWQVNLQGRLGDGVVVGSPGWIHWTGGKKHEGTILAETDLLWAAPMEQLAVPCLPGCTDGHLVWADDLSTDEQFKAMWESLRGGQHDLAPPQQARVLLELIGEVREGGTDLGVERQQALVRQCVDELVALVREHGPKDPCIVSAPRDKTSRGLTRFAMHYICSELLRNCKHSKNKVVAEACVLACLDPDLLISIPNPYFGMTECKAWLDCVGGLLGQKGGILVPAAVLEHALTGILDRGRTLLEKEIRLSAVARLWPWVHQAGAISAGHVHCQLLVKDDQLQRALMKWLKKNQPQLEIELFRALLTPAPLCSNVVSTGTDELSLLARQQRSSINQAIGNKQPTLVFSKVQELLENGAIPDGEKRQLFECWGAALLDAVPLEKQGELRSLIGAIGVPSVQKTAEDLTEDLRVALKGNDPTACAAAMRAIRTSALMGSNEAKINLILAQTEGVQSSAVQNAVQTELGALLD